MMFFKVRAGDLDEGTNGEVWYTIINGNENESFSLNRETGILYPAAALLGRAGSYRIEVEARDGAGSGPHSDKCFVDIRVTPVNQHKPQFVMPELTNATVEVPEACIKKRTFLVSRIKRELIFFNRVKIILKYMNLLYKISMKYINRRSIFRMQVCRII